MVTKYLNSKYFNLNQQYAHPCQAKAKHKTKINLCCFLSQIILQTQATLSPISSSLDLHSHQSPCLVYHTSKCLSSKYFPLHFHHHCLVFSFILFPVTYHDSLHHATYTPASTDYLHVPETPSILWLLFELMLCYLCSSFKITHTPYFQKNQPLSLQHPPDPIFSQYYHVHYNYKIITSISSNTK